MNNLTSRSTDSLLLTPPRGRSRARPVHLVRQALGIPHFGIAPGAVAPLAKKSAYAKNELAVGKVDERGVDVVPLPILSRPPLEIDTPGFGESLDESDETSNAPSLLPSSASQSPRVLYTRSRLPHISEQETALWRALHYFKPLRNDYASAFRLLSDSIVVPHPAPATHASSTTCPGFSSRAETYIPLIHRIFN
ncbi:hypothetical protein QFC20_004444 [Naganishia adeliensis]|uniref:Uncharacterized protein n=1 Tax=Naganishia adeliensis TaxID=92952 RepID=A0ACC2W0U1_9TREE|nr:hypothetical protein QFC20_004444 [Naganishia adeliensis]